MLYLDQAATSWPKPPQVVEAMASFLRDIGANPGRSGHRMSVEAGRVVYRARQAIAELFHVRDPLRVVLTPGATFALNLALQGLLHPGDHVVVGPMQHNSVMRPLRALEDSGVRLTVLPASPQGELDPALVAEAIRPETVLVVLNHASNVCGTLQPVAQVGQIVRAAGRLLLVDAAQTAGAVPIAMEEMGIDLLAFAGHKGLLGPTGTGGLVIGERVPLDRLRPLTYGGTGSRSEEERQPAFLPDKFEAGTQNAVGLAGLEAAVRYLQHEGVEPIRAREEALTALLLEGLQGIPGVVVYGTGRAEKQVAVVSFNIVGRTCSEVAELLDEAYGIACRPGLHCAPAAHRALGTFPEGTVRFSLGPFHTPGDVESAVEAVAEVAASVRRGR
ncbi:MAG: aminotransferase class V-fold PLP-dependent enzyme [Chloroflexia bacterium]